MTVSGSSLNLNVFVLRFLFFSCSVSPYFHHIGMFQHLMMCRKMHLAIPMNIVHYKHNQVDRDQFLEFTREIVFLSAELTLIAIGFRRNVGC